MHGEDKRFPVQTAVPGILDNLKPEGILVTKHGKPVARVIPAKSDCAELIGSLKGKLKIKGNILSTGTRWNAQS